MDNPFAHSKIKPPVSNLPPNPDSVGLLIAALQEQTRAINNLAASNLALVEQMAQQDDETEPDPDEVPESMSRKR